MKGYIYITGGGADPSLSNNMNDPIFSRVPTLGACMPNIRRIVEVGDFIFVVSGRSPGVQQYVVGGMQVAEKIHALEAFDRFPEYRLRIGPEGKILGNIICQPDGSQHHLDTHETETFEKRIENYIVGSNQTVLDTFEEVEVGRSQTLENLASILRRPRRNRVIDVMGRWSKLDANQVMAMIGWLNGIKSDIRLK